MYEARSERTGYRDHAKPAKRRAHYICEPSRNRKRTGGVELLSTDSAFYDGGRSCRHVDFPFGSEAIPARCCCSIHRLRVLPIVESEKMPAPAERDCFCPVVDLRRFRGHIHLLSSSDGERSRWTARAVIS